MRTLACFIVLTLLLSILPAAFAEANFYEAPKQITVTFTGDCTLGTDDRERNTKTGFDAYIQKYGYEYPFAKVRDIFEADDLTVINLEGVFYDYDTYRTDKTYAFRGPTDYVNILTCSSVEAVYLGNNHTLDYGEPGIRSTVETLESAGVKWFGTTEYTNASYTYEKDGVKIGFVSVYISYWWQGGRSPMIQLMSELRRDGCQVIVACMHGGVEYDIRHDNNQEKLATALLEYGADIIVGNHPHTLQEIWVRDGKTILWSLGNFAFGGNSKLKNNKAGELNIDTCIAQITFSFDENNNYLGHQLRLIPCHLSGSTDYNDYQPFPVTGKDAEKALKNMQRAVNCLRFNPFVEGYGSLQNFVAAPRFQVGIIK
ncbi:MAG: CapA family protein [Clostridia bacterium]|nr:CapA family protein [Clostridia bacterium]